MYLCYEKGNSIRGSLDNSSYQDLASTYLRSSASSKIDRKVVTWNRKKEMPLPLAIALLVLTHWDRPFTDPQGWPEEQKEVLVRQLAMKFLPKALPVPGLAALIIQYL